jgi:hypothetical protein
MPAAEDRALDAVYRPAAVSADDLRPCRRRVARGTAAIASAGHRPTLKPA